MYASRTTDISVEFLSWINEQLRSEIARQAADEVPEESWTDRAQMLWSAALSGISLTVMRWLQW